MISPMEPMINMAANVLVAAIAPLLFHVDRETGFLTGDLGDDEDGPPEREQDADIIEDAGEPGMMTWVTRVRLDIAEGLPRFDQRSVETRTVLATMMIIGKTLAMKTMPTLGPSWRPRMATSRAAKAGGGMNRRSW